VKSLKAFNINTFLKVCILFFLAFSLFSCRGGRGSDSNPYLKLKKKPSSELAGGNKRHIRKMSKAYIKEMKKNKKKLGH
jgi:hypothetical protein